MFSPLHLALLVLSLCLCSASMLCRVSPSSCLPLPHLPPNILHLRPLFLTCFSVFFFPWLVAAFSNWSSGLAKPFQLNADSDSGKFKCHPFPLFSSLPRGDSCTYSIRLQQPSAGNRTLAAKRIEGPEDDHGAQLFGGLPIPPTELFLQGRAIAQVVVWISAPVPPRSSMWPIWIRREETAESLGSAAGPVSI